VDLTKSETNNAIVTRLKNVRSHPNADRLKLATVLGTQVVVGLDSKEDDLVVYFDSNLRLSHKYLHHNNLYSRKEMNSDNTMKGYFGKNGRVRSQKFRGEVSNGFVADLWILTNIPGVGENLFEEGTEFTHINGIEICSKYVAPVGRGGYTPRNKITRIKSAMFHRHWDTKQLMRELKSIPEGATCYIEEKIHGTSGRTGRVLCSTNRPWWKFWKPKQEWKVISGTRRVDNINFHIPKVREEIERKVAPHLRKGETIYYEIYGYDINGSMIQNGFPYDCRPGEFKCMLYRVCFVNEDGFSIDLNRKQVYKRAEELGLEKPKVFGNSFWAPLDPLERNHPDYGIGTSEVLKYYKGKSSLDAGTLREGVVVWFQDKDGNWSCLKHKSEEFLMDQDKKYEKEEGDVEDNL